MHNLVHQEVMHLNHFRQVVTYVSAAILLNNIVHSVAKLCINAHSLVSATLP